MDARDIEKLVMKAKDDIIKEVHDKLPRKVGVVAVNHFKQNFRDGGWLDNGLHPWKRTRRQEGTGTNAIRGPLLSGREHLMKSIQASTSPQRTGSSRAREFHPHPLTEPCVKVSPHTALHTQRFVHRHNLGG